jgi:NAD(P)-dependent dehydrogenase (short-subunit alcohol dehydrogenase family)
MQSPRQAGAFPLESESEPSGSYSPSSIQAAFAAIKSRWPTAPLRVALFNAGHNVRKPFLDITPEEVRESVDTNIVAAFAFARETILAFKELDIDENKGKRGTLLFTGATASLRGNTTTSAFAAGKFGIRALAQSLAKEFGQQNIHVRQRWAHMKHLSTSNSFCCGLQVAHVSGMTMMSLWLLELT